MERKRIFCLDFIRAVALFCIIWCHTNNVAYDFYLMEKVKWFFGKCGVPLFFIISGYLAFPLNKPLKQYAIGKIKRVVIPFIAWVVIYAALAFFRGYPVFVEGDLLNEGSAHLWFIYVIIGLYLVVPILDPFIRMADEKVLRFYLVTWIFTGLFPLLQHITNVPFNEHCWMYTLYHLYGYTGYFILGYYLKKYGDGTRIVNLKISVILMGISILLVGTYFFVFDCHTVLVSDYKGLPIMLYAIAMYSILKKVSIYVERLGLNKCVTSLSVNSFGIYLIHMIVVMFIYPIIPQFSVVPALLTTTILVIINIALSYGVVYFASKFRYAHYIFG